jgi:hypothetical protein
MEIYATEGESPVCEIPTLTQGVSQVLRDTGNLVGIWADHGLRLNTQSKPIVEKNPGEGSEIEPEIIDLQAVEGLCLRFGEEMPDRVPFA